MNRRLSELVQVYDDVLPNNVCERMCRLFDASNAHRSEIEGLKAFDEFVIDGLPEWTAYQAQLESLKEQCLKRYKRDCPGEFPDRHDFEALRIKRYDASRSDQFRTHADGYNLVSAKRFLVCFWYLNDVEKGGETVFPRLRIQVRPRAGRVVMFPPFWMYDFTKSSAFCSSTSSISSRWSTSK